MNNEEEEKRLKLKTNLNAFNSIEHAGQIKQLIIKTNYQKERIDTLEDEIKVMKLRMAKLETLTANIEPLLAIEVKKAQFMLKTGLSPRSGSSSPRKE